MKLSSLISNEVNTKTEKKTNLTLRIFELKDEMIILNHATATGQESGSAS